MENPLDRLEPITETSLQEILVNMLDGEHDLDLKTHIIAPKDLSSLMALAVVLRNLKFVASAELIEKWLDIYLRYMVSYKRLSREEIIKAVSGLLDKESLRLTMQDKLTKNMKKVD